MVDPAATDERHALDTKSVAKHRTVNTPSAATAALVLAAIPAAAWRTLTTGAIAVNALDAALLIGVGLAMAYGLLRDLGRAATIVAAGAVAASLSLALVFYVGAIEVLVLGWSEPWLGRPDAALSAMPAVAFLHAYVISLRLASHRSAEHADASDSRTHLPPHAWSAIGWSGLFAAGLFVMGALGDLDLRRFGWLTALSVLASAAFTILLMSLVTSREGSSATEPHAVTPKPHFSPAPATAETPAVETRQASPIRIVHVDTAMAPANAALRAKLRGLRVAARGD